MIKAIVHQFDSIPSSIPGPVSTDLESLEIGQASSIRKRQYVNRQGQRNNLPHRLNKWFKISSMLPRSTAT